MMIPVDERLLHVRFIIDREPHITVDTSKCATCSHHACTYCCPAELYELDQSGIQFSFEGCLECGTCHIVCDLHAVSWRYPKGGYGVAFRFG
jgi:ferredoxin like protein